MHEHEPAAIMPAGSASMIRNLRTPGVQVIGRASVARIVEARKIRHERVMIAQRMVTYVSALVVTNRRNIIMLSNPHDSAAFFPLFPSRLDKVRALAMGES